MSANKTPNLGLNDWQGSENVSRTEFNENFAILDIEVVKQASATQPGRMSPEDYQKLQSIPANAEVNQNAFSYMVAADSSGNAKTNGTISAGSKTATVKLREAGAVVLTPNAATGEISIGVDTTTAGGTEASKIAKTNASGRVGDSEKFGGQSPSDLDTKYATTNHTHGVATSTTAGFMSALDKNKLDGVAAGAEVNQFTFSSVKAVASDGTTSRGQADADTKTDLLTLKEGTNIQFAVDSTTDTITVGVTGTVSDSAKLGGMAPGHASGQIPVSDGTMNVGLNAEKLGGKLATDFQLVGTSNNDVVKVVAVELFTDTRTTVDTYDPVTGFLTKQEEKNGVTVVKSTTFTYDAQKRLYQEIITAGSSTVTITYNYDAVTGYMTSETKAVA